MDSAKVSDMHEARAGQLSAVIGNAKVWEKITHKLQTGGFSANV